MDVRNSKSRFGSAAIALHWLTALLIAGAWILGQTTDLFARGDPRASAIAAHIGFGLAVLVAVAARLVWRATNPVPAPVPDSFGRWAHLAAEMVHYALYALMFLIPILGIATWFARGEALPVFGLFHIASPLDADRTLARSMLGLHSLVANVIVFLAGFHALAALAHHYVLHDETLMRMVPFLRRRHAPVKVHAPQA